MGFLDRAIDAVNAVARPFQSASTPVDPRAKRAARVAADGTATTARVVGIHRRPVGEHTETSYALELPGSATEGPRRIGVTVGTTRHLHRLRLGLEVPVRVDGDRGVIDWLALAARDGLSGSEPGQRRARTVPADGIVDSALDAPAAKRLQRGRRATGTITAFERLVVMGMPTVNWDVHLRLDDGSVAVVRRDEVPPYVWWSAVPGATVPVALDERDPAEAAVDWAAVAMSAPAPRVDDRPPPGSLAAEVDEAAAAEAVATAASVGGGPADTRATIAAHREEAQVRGTLGEWVGEVHAGRMKPKAFLKHVAEWESAGLCTAEEAAAARAAAGLAG